MDSLDTTEMFQGRKVQGRRLPVYLLLDCSSSMSGQPISDVRRGVTEMIDELRKKPAALDSVYIKFILFSSIVDEKPLQSLVGLQIPPIDANGSTAMGAALRYLHEGAQYGRDLIKNTSEQLGDWLPMVFLLTDGYPTDDYRQAAGEILRRVRAKSSHELSADESIPRLNVFAFGCGPSASAPMLHEVTDYVYMMPDMSGSAIVELFKWVTDSIGRQSQALNKVTGGTPPPTNLGPLPPQVMAV